MQMAYFGLFLGIIRFKMSLLWSCCTGLSIDVYHKGAACTNQNVIEQCFWKHFQKGKKNLGNYIFFVYIHTCWYAFQHTCLDLHAPISCTQAQRCLQLVVAFVNRHLHYGQTSRGEEGVLLRSCKTWLIFPWHHSSGINSVNVSFGFLPLSCPGPPKSRG